ncbi:L,D-transpeptidase family protein [Sphingomonas japonica]|uniref:Lipoprotein-anchoring transpeptidase ErfK/SrfK n=1 Tax=Sphingomonas japonica TaxID=511662 RepID=A0ABX0U355_9SPHN|nr:L,D-transpeptidase family protein [Sphingomonas japonica]NIJ24928.1 lipoprotein-anchoring transpeptidase ErfK/SrfK [Sphingomonas japonica]
MFDRVLIGTAGVATAAAAAMVFAVPDRGEAADTTSATVSAPAQTKIAKTVIDRSVLHVQVILDHLGFGPGVLDGREGQSLTAALRGFQTSRNLPVTGKMDQATLRALHPFAKLRPTRTLTLTPGALAGPYNPELPSDLNEQAELDHISYRSPMEKLAEMFHTKPSVLLELNSAATPLKPGTKIVFPNALPTSRDYDSKLPEDWRATLRTLNVDATQPSGDRVVVDESEGVLKVLDGDRLVAQFSATMGSSEFPLPIGEWTIKGSSYNPTYAYTPSLLSTSKPGAKKAQLPAGPNGPVGVVWMDLSKEHYGIHGTPEPEKIGRTESNGCIRLTNWDAARLSLMIKPGTKAVFQR